MRIRRFASLATLLALPVSLGCVRAVGTATPAPTATGVEPLQPFGSEPDLMPALTFEPLAGRLEIRAPHPVYVTVVEVDPATHAQRVVFPELGRAPLRVTGALSLQLALSRGTGARGSTRSAGQVGSESTRGRCATFDGGTAAAPVDCADAGSRDADAAPARTVLVIASTDTLVVSGDRGVADWRIPDEMPAEWAAVYVWAGARPSEP